MWWQGSPKSKKKKKKYDHVQIDPDYPCPECRGIEWLGIPDSLASACTGCGYVRVGFPGKYERGASLQEWARDIYEADQKRKRQGKREK
jgi:hypothetical protein